MDFKQQLQVYRQSLEKALDEMLDSPLLQPPAIQEAVTYSLKAGGKRLRSCLLLGAFDLYASQIDPLPAALAVECGHTSSLIHDDMPCMDDSPLRRGQPSCHKAFGEATALLTGNALLLLPFKLLGYYKNQAQLYAKLVEEALLAMFSAIEGQTYDLMSENSPNLDEAWLKKIHKHKTARLFSSSLVMGALIGNAPPQAVESLRQAGLHLGIAFQIIDDILDVTGEEKELGKPTGIDARTHKATYPALYGLSASREKAYHHVEVCLDYFQQLEKKADFCVKLARYVQQGCQ